MERRSRVAVAAAVLGLLAVADLALGPLLVRLGFAPMVGFGLIFPFGTLAALVAVVLGLLGLYLTRASVGVAGRSHAWLGLTAGGVFLAVLLAAAAPNRDAPPINDITTDFDDPPQFQAALRAEANAGRDMSYPPEFAEITREAYPDLASIVVSDPPADALARVREAAEGLEWEIVEVREESGELEARQTSSVFRFVDDIVIRVSPQGGGSIVDVRSKSRDGRGDLGANAARIRALRDALE